MYILKKWYIKFTLVMSDIIFDQCRYLTSDRYMLATPSRIFWILASHR